MSVKLVWWEITDTDNETFKLSDMQMQGVLKAEASGSRFVHLGDRIINPAFIKGAVKRSSERDDISLMHDPLTEEEKKYLVQNEQRKITNGMA